MKQLNFLSAKNTLPATMRVFAVVIFSLILFMGGIGTVKAQTAYVDADTVSQGDTLIFCASDYSQVHLTSTIANVEWQYTPGMLTPGSSVTLNSTNNGVVALLVGGSTIKSFRLYILSSPTSPALPDLSKCGDSFTAQADAGNSGKLAHYLWSTGQTTKIITITSEGTYSVTITNECGSVFDSFVVTSDHSNDVNLGHDITLCLNDSAILVTNNTNVANYLWSNGAITSTIKVFTTGNYSVTTTDNAGCISRDSIQITVLSPYAGQSICYVTKGFSSNLNEVVFNATPGERITYYNVKKESTITGVYILVKRIAHTGAGIITVIDTADHGTNQYTYNISIEDSCLNESPLGGNVKPIFSTLSVNEQGTYNMHLQQYYDQNNPSVPATTYIYSGDGLPLTLRDSIAGSVTDYVVPTSNTDSIFAAAVVLPCGSSKGLNLAFSNRVTKGTASAISEIAAIEINIYPNPAMNVVHVQCMDILSITLSDMTGRIIIQTTQKDVDVSTIPAGLYVLTGITKDSRFGHVKILVTH